MLTALRELFLPLCLRMSSCSNRNSTGSLHPESLHSGLRTHGLSVARGQQGRWASQLVALELQVVWILPLFLHEDARELVYYDVLLDHVLDLDY